LFEIEFLDAGVGPRSAEATSVRDLSLGSIDAAQASPSLGGPTPLTSELGGASRAVTLNGRSALLDLMAAVALDEGQLEPFSPSGR